MASSRFVTLLCSAAIWWLLSAAKSRCSANDELTGSTSEPSSAIVVVPAGWEEAAAEWSEYRQTQGYRVEVIVTGESAEATLTLLQRTAEKHHFAEPFILLAGDAIPIDRLHLLDAGEPYVPTFYLPSKAVVNFGGEPEIATDYPYADLDRDGLPECAVGRIPATSRSQLQAMLARTIAYERDSICGEWQYEMNMVAGIGGFSLLADMAISSFAKTLLTKSLPAEYSLLMTHASDTSPYFPPPTRFRDTVLNQLNRNGMLWVYVGHGHVQQLDQVQYKQRLYPILSQADVAALSNAKRGSLAFLLACYSGAVDAPQPCLAEQMIRHPQGPIAAVAATRVSMPYGMSVLAKEMLHEAFERRTATLGEILRNAKRTTATQDAGISPAKTDPLDTMMTSMASALSPADHDLLQERQEHLWLMNLLGDPTLRLPQSERLQFEVDHQNVGQQVEIIGQAAFPGEIIAQVQYERGRIPREALEFISSESRAKKENREISEEESLQRYNAANQIVIAEVNKAVTAGPFSMTLRLPEQANGKFIVRCTLCNRSKAAVGTVPLKITR